MRNFLRWPDEFEDPRAKTDFDDAFVVFLEQMIAGGAAVYADSAWCLFGLSRGTRMIDFVRRGRATGPTVPQGMYWEVWPHENGVIRRLGPQFGIREHACVVIVGLDDVRTLAQRWLDGWSMQALLQGVTFRDRTDATVPLKGVP